MKHVVQREDILPCPCKLLQRTNHEHHVPGVCMLSTVRSVWGRKLHCSLGEDALSPFPRNSHSDGGQYFLVSYYCSTLPLCALRGCLYLYLPQHYARSFFFFLCNDKVFKVASFHRCGTLPSPPPYFNKDAMELEENDWWSSRVDLTGAELGR